MFRRTNQYFNFTCSSLSALMRLISFTKFFFYPPPSPSVSPLLSYPFSPFYLSPKAPLSKSNKPKILFNLCFLSFFCLLFDVCWFENTFCFFFFFFLYIYMSLPSHVFFFFLSFYTFEQFFFLSLGLTYFTLKKKNCNL